MVSIGDVSRAGLDDVPGEVISSSMADTRLPPSSMAGMPCEKKEVSMIGLEYRYGLKRRKLRRRCRSPGHGRRKEWVVR